jgi:hypothetical protein
MEQENTFSRRPMYPAFSLPLFTTRDESIEYLAANISLTFQLQSGIAFDRNAAIGRLVSSLPLEEATRDR